jgi:hypothetical protein
MYSQEVTFGTKKKWPYKTGDLLKEVSTWTGFTVFVLGISTLPLSMIFLLDFGTVPTKVVFFYFSVKEICLVTVNIISFMCFEVVHCFILS